ncbi:Transposon Tf2-9 polyprotein [Araneus ventricosus]|uniref:RNA-directed DNA polymerase n=2 Tax=Araneus ventricosus TaxID=182803 RepID=A0A4Y2UZM9_ARAVE|nr:Transposon Tf2-9 polyprotein [Araneus ventricosus]
MNDKTNAKPDESGIVMQATNSVIIIPFDPNNSMNVNSWLKYFNDKCQEHNLDDTWKLNNITAYLKNNALTEYVNSYDTIKTWEEFISFLTERYISPNLVNLSDFTSKSFKEGDDITLYFQEKLKIGRRLNLATSMILEGLSDGLPVNLRQLLAINSPNNPTEWLTTASKLIKIQKSDENQINPSHSATQNLKTNSVSGNQWQPRNFRPHNFTPRQNFRPNNFQPNSPPRQNNNYQTPPPRQNFSMNLRSGMPELSKYDITIDCSKQKICQNGKNLNKSQNDKNHSNDKNKQNISLHISECKQINSHCSQTTEDQVNPPQSVTENKCELRKEVKDIIKNFDSVFSKDKYDVGALRVEPQRIVLNSDLPVSLRPYRTSPVEEQEIKSQVEKLLQAGLIKESNSPYSSPVTLAFKRDEAYHSRTLRDYEKNYAITELECLAIVDALDKFYYYLHGQKFVIHTDHAALVWLKNVKNLRGRLFRWSLKLSMFDYEIKYQKGCTNIEADMLSRHPISHHLQHSVHLLDINEIKTQQKNDNLCGPKYHEVKDVIVIKKRNLYKIVVPFSLRLKLLNQAHEQFGHPGVQKMLNLITPQYYWPNITSDITEFVKHCSVCQLNKKRKQKRFGLLQQVPPTSTPFECISVDTVGGFNYYNSTKKFLHIVIDHATRHVWAFPSKNENSETYINILKQIFQIQVPVKLLTDRNAAFTSSRFKKFLRNYNVKHLLTTAHHPQTNGKVERVNQSLVTRLKCKVNSTSTKVPWTKLLESVTNEYNLTPHSITKYPPAYLLLGTLPYDSPIGQNSYYEPVNEARNLALQRTIDYHNKNKIRYDARFVDKKFNPGDLVVYEEFHYPNTRKLTPPFSGPYEVIKQCSEVTYEINKPNPLTKQATQIVHISKLRCFHSPDKLKLSHE